MHDHSSVESFIIIQGCIPRVYPLECITSIKLVQNLSEDQQVDSFVLTFEQCYIQGCPGSSHYSSYIFLTVNVC